MRPILAAAAALLALAAGCGGEDRYAGLTEEQAGERTVAAVEAAQENGTMPAGIAAPPTTEEAMGRPGGNALGTESPSSAPAGRAARGAAPSGEPAWVTALAGPGLLTLCVYVWDGGSELAARDRC